MTAVIHAWCGQLDDPPRTPCPCRANTTTVFEVQRRHREATRRAGKAAPADPTGKRWAA